MTELRWVAALLLSCHLTGTGLRSKIVTLHECRDYLVGKKCLRVGLTSGAHSLRLVCAGGARLDLEGETLTWDAGKPVEVRLQDGKVCLDLGAETVRTQRLTLRPAREAATRLISDGLPPLDRAYVGAIEVGADRAGLAVINIVELDTYLRGVVPAEMPASFPMEALKAQAIAARTYALYQREEHQSEGFDLCSGVHCQVYRGAEGHPRTNAAIRATAGKVLAFGDVLVKTVYHSTCGGSTEDGWRAWWGHALPYLRARPDGTWCRGSAKYRWSREFAWPDAARAVQDNLAAVCFKPGASVGPLLDLRVERQTAAGRARRLAVIGEGGREVVFGDGIRWLFGSGKPGPGGLNSTFFTLSVERDAQGKPVRAAFTGRGWGHGLGLCQMGAAGRARAGQKAERILQWYYQGARVATVR